MVRGSVRWSAVQFDSTVWRFGTFLFFRCLAGTEDCAVGRFFHGDTPTCLQAFERRAWFFHNTGSVATGHACEIGQCDESDHSRLRCFPKGIL